MQLLGVTALKEKQEEVILSFYGWKRHFCELTHWVWEVTDLYALFRHHERSAIVAKEGILFLAFSKHQVHCGLHFFPHINYG